ncbi:MAG: CotH kinase family protein, partial [Pirellulales bacterium]
PTPLVVTATVTPKVDAATSVLLHYRTMFGAESTLPMFDDALHSDGAAGDHVFGATIPAGVAAAGHMLRYYVTTTDAGGRDARAPSFLDRTGTKQSPEYFGTVIANPAEASELPVLEWFAQNPSAAHTRGGSRAAAFYNGEFYDNVFIRERGAFTVGGSQKFVFNKGYGFKFSESIGRVEEFNLNTRGSDPSYMRQWLAFETYRLAGVASPESFPILVQLNGAFDRVGIFIEQVDADLLDRFGLDPEGALYKLTSSPNPAYSNGTVAEKKTRQDEDASDFQALVAGLNLPMNTPPQIDAVRAFVFDTFDLPALANYLAARTIVQDIDDTRKNHYVYRDTIGSGLWQILPWDKDWTFGEVGLGGTVVADRGGEIATGNANINFASHPFIGDSTHMLYQVQWSRLLDMVYKLPDVRDMYLRRLRSLMDEVLQPPGTPLAERYFENRIDEVFAKADPYLDASVTAAVNNLKNLYFEPKRISLYQTHGIDNTGMGSDPATTIIPAAATGARFLVPTSTTPSTAAWTALAFDDSAWTPAQFGIGYERTPGDPVNYTGLINTDIEALMQSRTSVYVRKPFDVGDLGAVRDVTLRIRYDDGFVAYLNGVEIARRNVTGTAAFNSAAGDHPDTASIVFESIPVSKTALRQGANVIALHGINASATSSDLLLDFELIEGPTATTDVGVPHAQAGNPTIAFGAIDVNPVSGNQDEEYIELVNSNAVAVDISGWQLTGGVEHTFDIGTVILPGGSLYVSPKQAAFRARVTGPRGGQGLLVQGNYDGHLSNFGEELVLLAADGSTVSSTTTPSIPSPAQQYLRITEIMYHPADPTATEIAAGFGDGDLFEFIELQNISGTETLDLSGVHFSRGIAFSFGDVDLPPGGFVVIASNVAAFAQRYGTNIAVAGEYPNNLSNGGESLRLDDADGSTIHDFAYDDTGEGWHPTTDGVGYSLVLVDATSPLESWSVGSSWRPSSMPGGSPGVTDPVVVGGDVNGDLRVDLVDLAILQAHFGIASEALRSQGDLNGDGAVNRLDAAILASNFGRSLTAPASFSASPVVARANDRAIVRAHVESDLLSAVCRRRRPGTDGFRTNATATDRALVAQLDAVDADLRSPRRARFLGRSLT